MQKLFLYCQFNCNIHYYISYKTQNPHAGIKKRQKTKKQQLEIQRQNKVEEIRKTIQRVQLLNKLEKPVRPGR